MNTNIQVKTENKYNIKVIRNGEVREEYNFSNTLCKGIITSQETYYSYIHIGKGAGTPSWDDTGLFSQLWQIEASVNYADTDASSKAIITASIPADSSHVGVITEVGVYTSGRWSGAKGLLTHALVTDAEGNPISINKTDLDVVIITIELIFTAAVDGSAPTQKTGDNKHTMIRKFLFNGYTNFPKFKIYSSVNGYPEIAYISSTNNSSDVIVDQVAKTAKNNKTTLRLGTGDANTQYIKAASLCNDCVWDLKDIFTPYTIQGASIGVGDGATTVFACPLSYFKEGTDRIYKNGTLLTRGVDYTLDNINNTGSAIFLHNDMHTAITGGEPNNQGYSSSYYYVQFFGASTIEASNYSATNLPSTYALSKDNPIYLDFGAPRKCNLLHLYTYNGNSGPVTLSYSTDGAAYTPVTEITDIQWNAGTLEKTFTPVTARYWRLSTSGNEVLYQCNARTNNTFPHSYLIYRTDGITFTTAPATGDIITMDATLDYPFKNDKHVIDINWTCTITLT